MVRTTHFKPGDLVGSHGMLLLSRLEMPGNPKAYFRCGRCGADIPRPIALSSVATDRSTSCGCYKREVSRLNAAKMNAHDNTNAVRSANGKASIAKISPEVRRANGKATFDLINARKRQKSE